MSEIEFGHRRRSVFQKVDVLLLLVALLILAFGLTLIYSATHGTHGMRFVWKQLLALAVGGVAGIVIALIPDHYLRSFAGIAWVLAMGLVLLVAFRGEKVLGAQRWLVLFGLRLQPSEFLKLAFILVLAKTVEQHGESPNGLANLVGCALLSGLTFLAIAKQPDLGTALSIGAITGAVLFVAGLNLLLLVLPICLFGVPVVTGLLMAAAGQSVSIAAVWPFALAVLVLLGLLLLVRLFVAPNLPIAVPLVVGVAVTVGILATPLIWSRINPYQIQRLTSFLQPESDSRGAGYQSIQSIIAIGSGGMWGKGLLRGPQNVLGFLPHRHTDFVFSVLGEEMGFWGVTVLMALFAVLLLRMIVIAMACRELFGTFVVTGVASLFAFHVFVNVGMTTGLMPVTGLPLVLVSYGGSSLVSSCVALGLVENFHRSRQESDS